MKVVIPQNLEFSALKLARDSSTGDISFDWTPIEAICDASGIDISVFRDSHEDNVSELIHRWYAEHRASGGSPDPVMDEMTSEVIAENLLGGGVSHKPGRA